LVALLAFTGLITAFRAPATAWFPPPAGIVGITITRPPANDARGRWKASGCRSAECSYQARECQQRDQAMAGNPSLRYKSRQATHNQRDQESEALPRRAGASTAQPFHCLDFRAN